MPIYDAGFKIVAHASGRELAEVAGLSCSRWRPIVSEVQVTERFADRAFRATFNGDRCVVYFEAYTRWRKKALWNVQAKAAMLSEREQLPALTVLYILQPRGYQDLSGEFGLQVGGRPTQRLWYYPVPLWRQTPADWWQASPGLMALYPLTQHGRPPQEAVQYAAEAIRTTVAETDLQADLLTSLGYFGGLAYPDLKMLRLIGSEQMKGSKFFRELFAEDREHERLQGWRAAIQRVVETRFGKEATTDVVARLAGITDETELDRLAQQAGLCTRVEEFLQQLVPDENA